MSNDRFKFRIAVFERYNNNEWEFTKFIKNTDKFGVSTNGNVIQENVQGYIIHLTREKTPKNVYRTMEVMQCTGLKDKNGKLIFEGDIVRFKDNITINGSKTHIAVIEHNEAFNAFMYHAECMGLYTVNKAQNEKFNIEVIGNIYENHKLIERMYNEKNNINF